MLALGYASAKHFASGPGFEPLLGPSLFFSDHLSYLYCSTSFDSVRAQINESVHQGWLRDCEEQSVYVIAAQHERATPNLFLYGNTRPWSDRSGDSRASFPSMVLTVHRDDYKHSEEAFVAGMTGSTVSHVNMIALVALVCLHPLL